MSDFKQPARYRASIAEWEFIRTWLRRETCWICGEPWTELHHILSRGQGGDDVIEDLAPLCASCHRRIEARDVQARAALRGALMPTNLAYLHDKLGERTLGWLDRNYPARAAA